MTVRYRHANTLRGEFRAFCRYYFAVFYLTPNFKRLFFALFFLAADKGDNVIYHFGPAFKGLARARNCLIGGNKHPFNAEFFIKRVKGGHIALQRAV